jgi:transcriptional regulator with XRE-family HTH domain
LPAVTSLQVRLARCALGLSLRELATAAKVSPNTITRFELGKGGLQTASLGRLQEVLEHQGVVFVAADQSGSATVRLKS